MLAKFHERYGAGLYYRWGRGWPTTDGTIPYKLFVVLLLMVGMTEAGQELLGGRAAALGRALVTAGDSAQVKAVVRELARRAYPERYDKP